MSNPVVLRPARRLSWPLLAILALATIVRWSVIDRDALWLDEGYSWWDAHQRLTALWTLVPTCDPHPPLYFALLHPWILLVGDGTVAMRTLSTLFGVATIAVVYAAGRELDRVRGRSADGFGIGVFAALLFALTPFQVYFSIEARPYALLCFGAALLTLGCLRLVPAMRSGGSPPSAWNDRMTRPRWVLLVAGALIVVWSNNTAVLVLGAVSTAFIAFWVLDRDSRRLTVPILVAGVVVALLWAPDWPLLIAQAREVTNDFWIPAPSFEGVAFELHNLIGLDVLRATWWVALTIVGGLMLIARRAGWRAALMVASLAVLPIVFNVAISFAVKPILISRALMGAAPALALALAASVVLLRNRTVRTAAAIVLVAVHAISLSRFLAADHIKEPWKPVVARLAKVAPTAPILVVPNELVLPLSHEARMQRVDVRVIGLPADYPAVDLPVRYPSGKCAPSVVAADLSKTIGDLRDERVVILLTRLNNTYDPAEAAPAAMRAAGFKLQGEDVYQPGDLRLMRFVRGAS